jgi:hypothetical protein
MVISGKLLKFDKPNSNCHIYPKEVFEKAIRDYNGRILKKKRKEKIEKLNKNDKTK